MAAYAPSFGFGNHLLHEPSLPTAASVVGVSEPAPPPPPAETPAGLQLLQLPSCALFSIASHLGARELCALAAVSRELEVVVAEPLLWRELTRTRFEPVRWALPEPVLKPSEGRSWRQHYFWLNQRYLLIAAAAHSSQDSCWIVVDRHVYDVTTFLDEHPGSSNALLLFGGGDASQVFHEVAHSQQAIRRMESLKIGALDLPAEGCPLPLCRTPPASEPAASGKLAIDWAIDHIDHVYSVSAANDAAAVAGESVEALAESASTLALAAAAHAAALGESLRRRRAAVAEGSSSLASSLAASLPSAFGAEGAFGGGPFSAMPSLPSMPSIYPSIPSIPSMYPSIPSMPSMPSMYPSIPSIPSMYPSIIPSMPSMPSCLPAPSLDFLGLPQLPALQLAALKEAELLQPLRRKLASFQFGVSAVPCDFVF